MRLDKDMPALEVLSAILTEGHSSRLYSRMVDREQIALTASPRRWTRLDPGDFIFFVRPRAGVDVATYREGAVRGDRKAANDRGTGRRVTKSEESAADQFLSRDENHLRPGESTWHRLKYFTAATEAMYDTPTRYEAVTPADVLRVAKQYLGPNQRTIATLIPEVAK